jgi:hypothetical protein
VKNFTFVIKHISRNANKVVDALSRGCLIMQEFSEVFYERKPFEGKT